MHLSPRVTLVLLLSGCAAHSPYLRDGDRQARYGDWEQAVRSYEQAARLSPDNARVAARLDGARAEAEAAREAAIAGAMRRIGAALSNGDLARVSAPLAELDRLDPTLAATLRADAVSWARRELTGLRASSRLFEAHALSVALVDALGTDPAATAELDRSRREVLRLFEALLATGRFPEALDAAQRIAATEPLPEHTRLPRDASVRWASDLGLRAKAAAAAGHLGEAALLYARAHEVDADPMWRIERDRMTEQLATDHRHRVKIRPARDARSQGLTEALTVALRDDPRVIVVTSGPADLTLQATATAATCADSHTDRTAETPVRVGSQQVANPAHATATSALRTAERAVADAEDALAVRTREHASARASLDALVAGDLPAARAALERAEADVAWARRRLAEAEDALAVALAAVTDPAVPGPEVAARQAELASARYRLDEAERAATPARAAWDRVSREHESQVAATARAAEAAGRAEDALRRAHRDHEERTRALASTPPERTEDVFEPFRWPVQDWRRTCSVTATITWQGGGADGRFTHDASRFTEDRRHDAWPTASIAADPLVWPVNDAGLIADADGALARAATADVSGAVSAFYVAMWRRGVDRLTVDPAEAADDLLATLALAPGLSEPVASEALAARYELSDLSWARR